MITTKTAPKNSKPKWDDHIPELGYGKKSVKIPKRQSEYVNRRRTDNTMAKRKKYKGTNNDLQNIHIKLKID